MENELHSGVGRELEGIRDLVAGLAGEMAMGREESRLTWGAEVLRSSSELRISIRDAGDQGPVMLDRFVCELIVLCQGLEALVAKKTDGGGERRSAGAALGLEQLAGLLVAEAREYGDTFGLGAKVPRSLAVLMLRPMLREWKKMVARLKDTGLDAGVVGVMEGFAIELQESALVELRILVFIEQLTGSLSKIELAKPDRLDAEVLAVFCYHNFNYLPLIRVLASRYQRDYNLVDSYREEYFAIVAELRVLGPLPVRQCACFDRGVDSLRDILFGVLAHEKNCIRKMMNLNKASYAAKALLRQFYFRISISMEQFLFLFRLMIDKDIVLVGRKADLYEFIHHHVGTAKKDNLSIGNMQNSFSENNRMTAIRVRAMLQSLITHIDQKYL